MIPALEKTGECLLCSSPVQYTPTTVPMRFECNRCGHFYVFVEAAWEINEKAEIKPYLSAATRQVFARRKMVTLNTDNYRAFADEHRWTSVQEKSRKILAYIRAKTTFYSDLVALEAEIDYPLFDAVSAAEYAALVNNLYASGLLSHGTAQPERPDHWCLTMKGWDTLEPLQSGGIPGRCFVAMAFDPELDAAYYDAIKPAIAEAGYEPVCLKDRLPKDDICDVILAEIRKAQFIVADFTKQKGGVYFEAGFAKALGKDVFWTCREDDFERLHFDTNHYGHVKWSEPADLKKQLRDWIIAELGFGPHRTL